MRPSRLSSAAIRCECSTGMSWSAVPCMMSTGVRIRSAQRIADRRSMMPSRFCSLRSGKISGANFACDEPGAISGCEVGKRAPHGSGLRRELIAQRLINHHPATRLARQIHARRVCSIDARHLWRDVHQVGEIGSTHFVPSLPSVAATIVRSDDDETCLAIAVRHDQHLAGEATRPRKATPVVDDHGKGTGAALSAVDTDRHRPSARRSRR